MKSLIGKWNEFLKNSVSNYILTRRPGDVATSYADVTLAAKELGWKAKRGLKEMCEDTWNWQRLNPNGFAGVN